MKSVLIIDDVQDIANIIKSAIEEGIEGSKCEIETDFSNAADRITEIRPDAVVLDLMKGQQSTVLSGEQTWRTVWEKTFCPIIIYTGSDADLQPDVPGKHPFVRRIKKGGGTESQVVEALKGFSPAVESVRKLRAEVEAVIHKVLRDTAGDGLLVSEPHHLLHAGRRRIAATMDDPTITSNRSMASWEQYLIPAIGDSPLTGDVLVKQGASRENPENYRLVLSPSCDLVRRAKVKSVLAAKCHPPKVLLDKFRSSVKTKGGEEFPRQLIQLVLTQGSWNGWMPLPEFPGVLPSSIAYLKDLELIDFALIGPIGSDSHGFLRIASIDSPFREQVAWAYLTTAARPGMPEREMQLWAEELIKAAEPK